MNKKILVLIIVIILLAIVGVVFLVTQNSNQNNDGTNNLNNGNNNNNNQGTVSESVGENTQITDNEVPTEGSNTLVVYFSAQGHTEEVAQKIANNLGADIFEIVPVEEYTSEDLEWTDSLR